MKKGLKKSEKRAIKRAKMNKKALATAAVLASTVAVMGSNVANAEPVYVDGYNLVNGQTISLEADKYISNTVDTESSGRKTAILTEGQTAINTNGNTLYVESDGANARNYIYNTTSADSDFTFTGNLDATANGTGSTDMRGLRQNAANSSTTWNGSIKAAITSENSYAMGIDIWDGSKATFEGSLTDISTKVTGSGQFSYALQNHSSDGSKVYFNADQTNLTAEGGSFAEAMAIHQGSVYLNGNANITAKNGLTGTRAINVESDAGNPYPSEVYLKGNEVNVNAISETSGTIGLFSSGTPSLINSEVLNLTVNSSSENNEAWGIDAQYNGTINLKEGTNTTVNSTSGTSAFGVLSKVYSGLPGNITSNGNLTVNATAANMGIGVYVVDGSSFDAAQVTATGTATGDGGLGIGAYIGDATGVVFGSENKTSLLKGIAENGFGIGLNIEASESSASATLKGTMTVEGSSLGINNEAGTLTNDADLTVKGGIYNSGTFTSTENSKLTANDGTAEATGGYGGAIYNEGTMTISNDAVFTDNTAAVEGGAIYNTGTLSLGDNIQFIDNKAGEHGSDIRTTGTGNSVTIGNNLLIKRTEGYTADHDCSIYAHDNASITIGNNATFDNVSEAIVIGSANAEIGDNATFDGIGHAIATWGGTVSVGDNATFQNGVWRQLQIAEGQSATIEIGDNALFENNIDSGNGAAVAFAGDGASTTKHGTYSFGDDLIVRNNASTSTSNIYNGDYGEMTFKSAEFKNNSSGSNAGVLRNWGFADFNGDVNFEGNTAENSGGAITNDVYGNSTVGGIMTFDGNTVFKNNTAINGDGGAIANNEYNRTSGSADIIFNGTAEFDGNSALEGRGGAIYNNSYATITFNNDATFKNNTATDAVIYNAGTTTLNGETTFTGNTNGAETPVKIADIYNTGTLNLNGTTNLEGGILGSGIVNLGGSSYTNMLGEETTGSSIITASTLDVTSGAKLALDWGDTINAAAVSGGTLTIDKLYVGEQNMTDGNSIALFTGDGYGTLDTSGIGLYGRDGKYTVDQTANKNLTLSLSGSATGLTEAIVDTNAETVFSFSGNYSEEVDGATAGVHVGNLNVIGDSSTVNNLTLKEDAGIDVKSGHTYYMENVNLSQENGNPALDLEAGANAKFVDSSVDKAANDGNIQMEFTADKDIQTSLTGGGSTDFKSDKNVNWDTTGGVHQKTMTFEGEGHIELSKTDSSSVIVDEIINNVTGSTLVLDGLEIAGDGATYSGDVTNTELGHLEMSNNTNVAGTITNDGLFDIKDGDSFIISANGIVDTAGTGAKGTLNIGGATNDTIVDASTNHANIKQNIITIKDKGNLSVDADKLTTALNSVTVNSGGALTLTGGTDIDNTVTNNNAVTGDGTTVINGFVTQADAKTINTTGGINVTGTGALVARATDLGAAIATAGTVKLTEGTLTKNITDLSGTYGDLITANGVSIADTANVTVSSLTTGTTLTNAGTVTIKDALSNGGTITNNATLNFAGGTAISPIENTGTIDGSGTLNIGATGGAYLTNSGSGTITQDVVIASTGHLTTAADKVTDADGISNAGVLNLTGTTTPGSSTSTASAITNTAGTTNITAGNVTAAHNITQTAVNVNAGTTLINSATMNVGTTTVKGTGKLVNNGTISKGTANSVVVEASGTLENVAEHSIAANITNTGTVTNLGTITSDSVITNNAGGVITNTGTISSTSFTNKASGTVNSTAAGITGGINNQGTLNISAGTLGSAINDTQETKTGVTNFAGTISTNSKTITQSAVTVGFDGTANAASTVTNTGTIAANVNITETGVLNTATGGLTGATIKNDGTLKFTNTTDGTIAQSIDEYTTDNGGTVEIAASTGKKVSIGSGTIANNEVKLTSGIFDVTAKADTDGNINLTSIGTKITAGNDGILSVQDGKTGTITLGNVDVQNKNLNVAIDLDLVGNGTTGAADKLTLASGKAITGDNKINISNITLTSDAGSVTPDRIQIADNTISASVSLGQTSISGTDIGNLLLSPDSDTTGLYIKTAHSDLTNAITSTIKSKAYLMGANEIIDGPLTLRGDELSVTGAGYKISSTTAGNNGIDVNGKSLSIENATIGGDGSTTKTFGTAIDNTDGGTVTLTSVTTTGNTVDVDNSGASAGIVNLDNVTMNTATTTNVINDGEGTKGVFITGTSSINKIVDKTSYDNPSAQATKGQITIGNGDSSIIDTATIGTISQKNVNILADGILNIDADKLIVSDTTSGTANAGQLNLAGGADADNAKSIASIITGATGTTNLTGYINNAKTITQKTVNVGTNVVTAYLTNGEKITADDVVVVTGSTLINNDEIEADITTKGTVTNNASATITGDVTNNGTATVTNNATATITGDVTNTSTGTVTNEGSIGGSISNSGGGTFNNTATTSSVTGTASNTSGTLNTRAGKISGAITNNATLNITGGSTLTDMGTTISGSGDTTVVSGKVNFNNNVLQDNLTTNNGTEAKNSATMTIADTITVASTSTFTNAGTASADKVSVKNNSTIVLAKGSSTTTTSGLTLENTGSTMTIVDNATISGPIAANGSNVNLYAQTQNLSLASALGTTDITGTYVLNAKSASSNVVTIDKAITNATSVNVEDASIATMTEAAFASNTTAPITVGDDSLLTLNNTAASTMNVQNTISPAAANDEYDIDVINDSASGITNLNAAINKADDVTMTGGTTNINSVITAESVVTQSGTTNVNAGSSLTADDFTTNGGTGNINTAINVDNVKAYGGTTNLNSGTTTSTGAYLDDAKIDIADGATMNVNTTASTYTVNNSVEGDSTNSIMNLVGTAGTPGSKDDVGTQFAISSNIDTTGLFLTSGQLNLPDESKLVGGTVATAQNGATLNAMDGSTTKYNKVAFENGAQLKGDVSILTGASDNFSKLDTGNSVFLTDLNISGAESIVHNYATVNLSNAMGLSNLSYSSDLVNTLKSKYSNVLTPIRRLRGFVYKQNGDLMLTFQPTGNTYKDFNPAVMASPVAAQVGGYLTQLYSYDQAFKNMDMYMMMTSEQRQAMKLRNKYADIANQNLVYQPKDSSIYDNAALWFNPYSTFENVQLRGGVDVNNVAYGSYFGGDSPMYDLGHGWEGMYSIYFGYNGSHQTYDGIGIYQNGGTFGVAGMVYKNNFFAGLTANVGGSAGSASTTFGTDYFGMLNAGTAAKAGYNWELANGKFIIQPSLTVSYSFVNVFDYRNAAGVNISSDPLNAIHIEPGIKFIGNFKNGWQPYAGISFAWNIMDQTRFRANEVGLPDLSIKPYIKYGIGLRKVWGDRFAGFAQAYFTGIGRTGVGLQAGFRWTLGKGGDGSAKKLKSNIPDREAKLNLSSAK